MSTIRYRRATGVAIAVLAAAAFGWVAARPAGAPNTAFAPQSGVVINPSNVSILYTSGRDGATLYRWDLSDAEKAVVHVYSCRPSLTGEPGSIEVLSLAKQVGAGK